MVKVNEAESLMHRFNPIKGLDLVNPGAAQGPFESAARKLARGKRSDPCGRAPLAHKGQSATEAGEPW